MARTRAWASPSGWRPRGDGRCRHAGGLPRYSHCLCSGPYVSFCTLSHGGERHGADLGISWRVYPGSLEARWACGSHQTVQVTADVFEQQVQFEIEPEEVGEFTIPSVWPRTSVKRSRKTTRRTFLFQWLVTRFRVLLVCGSPTWNYRFLASGFEARSEH